jgi:hypothetical protein
MVQTLSIRTKLIMAMLALVASVALMGVTANDANAAVTVITKVCNETNKEIYIWNHESGKRIQIAPAGDRPPRRTCQDFNEWVPWAWTADRFDEGHYIEVGNVETFYECGGIVYCARFSFWQEHRKSDGDKVRYTGQNPPDGPRNYRSYADPIPGSNITGSRRSLYIKNLGSGRPINIDVELVSPFSEKQTPHTL